ncbi:MAG: HD domain-containing protein [Lachnospiraceae bacterium]|nr:HD domain-containing protein [Lachnospiraceae bacterium]MCI8958887.1 HD domain-containing protein [Lachnospiraceae bacterium]
MVKERTTRRLLRWLQEHNGWGYEHSLRVGSCAGKAGRCLGLGEADIRELATAAHLHDIGKLLVPARILDKPGSLNEEEYQAVRQHADYGCRILQLLEYPAAVCEAVRDHHERYDGNGYRKQKETGLYARIISVADVWDAMGSSRPYRDGMDVEVIYQAMKEGCGSQFDPDICRAMFPVLFPGR